MRWGENDEGRREEEEKKTMKMKAWDEKQKKEE